MATQTTAPTQAPQAPATLDGVSIQDCQFTESVGKREPRPPLFLALCSLTKVVSDDVLLRIPGRRVLVNSNPHPLPGYAWGEDRPGIVLDGEPKGPAYTGPIHDSWWPIIRKYWNP